jgi:hypothetical protein
MGDGQIEERFVARLFLTKALPPIITSPQELRAVVPGSLAVRGALTLYIVRSKECAVWHYMLTYRFAREAVTHPRWQRMGRAMTSRPAITQWVGIRIWDARIAEANFFSSTQSRINGW